MMVSFCWLISRREKALPLFLNPGVLSLSEAGFSPGLNRVQPFPPLAARGQMNPITYLAATPNGLGRGREEDKIPIPKDPHPRRFGPERAGGRRPSRGAQGPERIGLLGDGC